MIKPRESSEINSEFESQIFLFEAAGYLISSDGISYQRQDELLKILMAPSMNRIEEILMLSSNTVIDDRQNSEISDLISSLGAITKGFEFFNFLGFPDYEKSKRTVDVWPRILQGVFVVLSRFNMYPNIRKAVLNNLICSVDFHSKGLQVVWVQNY